MRVRAFAAHLVRLDAAWTRAEAVLCVGVIALEMAAFSFWIALKGMASPSEGKDHAGFAFRATVAAAAFGFAAHAALARRSPAARMRAVLVAGALGIALAFLARNAGISYFTNWLNWLQDASALTLLGGLRGVGTVLTWGLAMLGGSLATGGGKHIHVDVVLRFLRPRFRLPAVALGWVAAAVVCLTAVWGFFDHISIESFGAPASATPVEKMSTAREEGARHFFLLRQQVGLDVSTSFQVMIGRPYDGWLYGQEWNEWVRAGAWDRYFPEDQVRRIVLPHESLHQLHAPLVVMPSGGNVRGLIASDLHLIFPFGFLIIGFRFLLRALLACWNVAPPLEYGEGASDPEARLS
jgi:hypothetical protein